MFMSLPQPMRVSPAESITNLNQLVFHGNIADTTERYLYGQSLSWLHRVCCRVHSLGQYIVYGIASMVFDRLRTTMEPGSWFGYIKASWPKPKCTSYTICSANLTDIFGIIPIKIIFSSYAKGGWTRIVLIGSSIFRHIYSSYSPLTMHIHSTPVIQKFSRHRYSRIENYENLHIELADGQHRWNGCCDTVSTRCRLDIFLHFV